MIKGGENEADFPEAGARSSMIYLPHLRASSQCRLHVSSASVIVGNWREGE